MKLFDSLEWRTTTIVVQHFWNSFLVITLFAALHYYMERVLTEGWHKTAVIWLDEFALVGTFLWLMWEMAVLVYDRRAKIEHLVLV